MGKILKEKGFNIRLIIAGKGEIQAKLKDLIKEHNMRKYVTFTGHLNQSTRIGTSFFQKK